MDWSSFIQFIPAAVILSVIVFFVRFFGKAVADQIPYADNRDWSIEFSGLWFFIDFLFPPILIAASLLWYFNTAITGWFDQLSVALNPISE